MNTQLTGEAAQSWLDHFLRAVAGRRFENALVVRSPGLDVESRLPAQSVYVLSAGREAEAAGDRSIRLEAGFDGLALEPRQFDLILWCAASGGVDDPRSLAETLWAALRPGGVFVCFDRVGAAACDWQHQQRIVANLSRSVPEARLSRFEAASTSFCSETLLRFFHPHYFRQAAGAVFFAFAMDGIDARFKDGCIQFLQRADFSLSASRQVPPAFIYFFGERRDVPLAQHGAAPFTGIDHAVQASEPMAADEIRPEHFMPLPRSLSASDGMTVILQAGWYRPENWGDRDAYWMARDAMIRMAVDDKVLLALSLDIHPSEPGKNRLHVKHGPREIADIELIAPLSYDLYLAAGPPFTDVTLTMEGPLSSPRSRGLSSDSRVLGCAMMGFRVRRL